MCSNESWQTTKPFFYLLHFYLTKVFDLEKDLQWLNKVKKKLPISPIFMLSKQTNDIFNKLNT